MEAIIKIDKLCKTFDTKSGTVKALHNIDLDIANGEIFGIIGLSGAGKSTLVRCINYLEVPTSGDVIFEGRSLTRMSEKERRLVRRSMGMVFQQFNLLAQRNVLGNVRFPLELAGVDKKTAEERAMELLELVGLSDKVKHYPAQLSGGQKQRVAIARAIANKPKVLLCDEATSALDPNTTKQILELIRDINKKLGITVIVITHEMQVIELICDRVAIIADSRIAETGAVADIFSDPKSRVGKQLILGEALPNPKLSTGRKFRVAFDGRNSFEPIIANLILKTGVQVSILYATLRDISGTMAGHMVLQLPDNETDVNRVINYLSSLKIQYEEVTEDDLGSGNRGYAH